MHHFYSLDMGINFLARFDAKIHQRFSRDRRKHRLPHIQLDIYRLPVGVYRPYLHHPGFHNIEDTCPNIRGRGYYTHIIGMNMKPDGLPNLCLLLGNVQLMIHKLYAGEAKLRFMRDDLGIKYRSKNFGIYYAPKIEL